MTQTFPLGPEGAPGTPVTTYRVIVQDAVSSSH